MLLVFNSWIKDLLLNSEFTGSIESEEVNKFTIEVEIISTKNPKFLNNIQGEITFKNISFSYDNKVNSLNSINLKIRANENIVLVGSNGSGKSTFINLIPRLIEPSKGSIIIDGTDIKSLEVTKLRSNISLVSQDIILFDLSILENLKLAN